MYNRRKTDQQPERPPAVGTWIVEAAMMVVFGIVLALIFASSGVRAGTITLHATQYDPLKGTSTYQQALDRTQYAGTGPYALALHTTAGQTVQGILDRPVGHLHYYCQAPNVCRLDTTFTTYIPGRVFAAGFEK